MPLRTLTPGVKSLLQLIFGPTLPYEDQQVGQNDREWGGSDNSITPGVVPLMAKDFWALDYSSDAVADHVRWDFIHEMAHVWHEYHVRSNQSSFIWTALKHHKNYDPDAYKYDLAESSSLIYYNFEQQASIIADYWYVRVKGYPARYNTGSKTSADDYGSLITQVRTAGPPKDLAAYANRSDSRPL
jgi:hypothetical protein